MTNRVSNVRGLFILCPKCDRDVLEVVGEAVPFTPIKPENFRAIEPTKMKYNEPVTSGCCKVNLLDERNHFIAMRTAEYAK